MSVDLPTEYGGAGQSFFASILVIEAMSKVDPSVGLLVDLQNTLLNRLFLSYGDDEQKQRYLPRMAKDLVCSSFSFSTSNRRDETRGSFSSSSSGRQFLSLRTNVGQRRLRTEDHREETRRLLSSQWNENVDLQRGVQRRVPRHGQQQSSSGRATTKDFFIIRLSFQKHKGISTFIVDRETEGLRIGKREIKLGLKASSTCMVHFDDCKVSRVIYRCQKND